MLHMNLKMLKPCNSVQDVTVQDVTVTLTFQGITVIVLVLFIQCIAVKLMHRLHISLNKIYLYDT